MKIHRDLGFYYILMLLSGVFFILLGGYIWLMESSIFKWPGLGVAVMGFSLACRGWVWASVAKAGESGK